MKNLLPLFALSLSCSPQGMAPESSPAAALERFPTLSPASGFPLTIRHPGGRISHLEAMPTRILPGNSGIVDFLSLIVEADQIAALPKGTHEYSRLRQLREGPWGQLPVYERYAAEEILSRLPDLVLTNDWQNPESNQILGQNGVLVLSLATPRSWDEVLQELQILGRLCGQERRAAQVREQLEGRRLALEQDPNFGQGLRVLSYSNFGGGGFGSGKGSTMDLLLTLAGFVNAASEAGLEGECSLNFELLLTIDPDILLVSRREDGSSASGEILLTRSELAGLKALKSGRLAYLHKALFSSPSTELIQAAEELQLEVRRLMQLGR